MKYFKKDGEVFAFEADGSQDHLITPSFVAMTPLEVDQHLNPKKYLTEDIIQQQYLASLTPLTRRQFRLVLVLNGFSLDGVQQKIEEIEDDLQRQIALIEWEDATNFERLNPTLIQVAGLLGLTDEQVNQMWEEALTL